MFIYVNNSLYLVYSCQQQTPRRPIYFLLFLTVAFELRARGVRLLLLLMDAAAVFSSSGFFTPALPLNSDIVSRTPNQSQMSSNKGTGSNRTMGVRWTASGIIRTSWLHRIARTIFDAAYSGSNNGSRRGHRDCAPSNIPVLIKKGLTHVVFTPSCPKLRISKRIDSSKPTAA